MGIPVLNSIESILRRKCTWLVVVIMEEGLLLTMFTLLFYMVITFVQLVTGILFYYCLTSVLDTQIAI